MTGVALIDYGMGNISSVLNACEVVGIDARLTRDPVEIGHAAGIILPGVGAFGDAMDALESDGLDQVLIENVLAGKPFIGLCLGMQLIASVGMEHGERKGLGLVSGKVEKLDVINSDMPLRLPHIGWNTVNFFRKEGLFDGLGDEADFYFVHSYAFRPEDPDVIAGTCDHGETFVAAIEAGNVWAAQFHPEKSQKNGLALLANWKKRLRC